MDIGRELIAKVLQDRSALKKFLEAGFDLSWLTDKEDLSRAAIFGEQDIEAYRFILRHWERERAVPSRSYFEHSFPPRAFRLPESDLTVAEVLAMASEDRQRVQLEIAGSAFIDLHADGQYDEAIDLIEAAAKKIRRARTNGSVYITWDGEDYDLEARLDREETPGVPTGIRKLDDSFAGWQECQLITYLGRAKSCKTSHGIKSALAAHDEGYNVLLVSVEIDANSIADRCDAFSAGVEHDMYIRGRLTSAEKKKLRAAKSQRGRDGYFSIVQPVSQYTITDLEGDIDRFNPGVVYVDGFYFLTDRNTGKTGGQWEGHDNLARELKELAMRRRITIIVTMQVREKQTHGKGAFDDNTMMGGTGLIMASDMVLALDMDKETWTNTISCSRSRTRYLPTVRGTWKWKYSSFEVLEDEWFDNEEEDDE